MSSGLNPNQLFTQQMHAMLSALLTNLSQPSAPSQNANLDTLDTDFFYFKLWASLRCPDFESYLVASDLTVLHSFHSLVEVIFDVILKECPDAFCMLLDNPKAKLEDCQEMYYLAISDFERSKNPKKLIRFFEQFKKVLTETAKKNMRAEKSLQKSQELFSNILQVITARPDWLFEPLRKYITPPAPSFNAQELQKGALLKCKELCYSVQTYLKISQKRTSELSQNYSSKSGELLFQLIEFSLSIIAQIKDRTDLSGHAKTDLIKAILSLQSELSSKSLTIASNFDHHIFDDLNINYISIILALDKKSSKDEIKSYIQKNELIFSSFAERTEAILNDFLELTSWIKKLCEFIGNLPLYLGLADLKPLISILNQQNVTLKQKQNSLLEEIERFSLTVKSPSVIGKVVSLLSSEKMRAVKKTRSDFNSFEDFWTKEVELAATIIRGGGLKEAKDCMRNLFLKEPQNNLNFLPQLIQLEVTTKEEKAPAPSKATNNVQSNPRNLQIADECQNAREDLLACINELTPLLKNLETNEALLDARTQFLNMLCVLNDISNPLRMTHSKNDLVSLIKNCVRFGSLAVEQVISSLHIQTTRNNKLKQKLHHDIHILLYSCTFKAGPLPNAVWTWVKENNRGELLVRDTHCCLLNSSQLESFLARTVLYSKGEVKEDTIIDELVEFLKGVGTTYITMITQINASCQAPSKSLRSNIQHFKNSFAALIKVLRNHLLSTKFDNSTFATQSSVRDIFEKFINTQTSNIIRFNLEKSLSNYIEFLEFDLSSQQFLSETSVLPHLSSILLNNQLMAESFLNNLIDARNIQFLPSKSGSHHLLHIAKDALGINVDMFSPDERAWMSRDNSIMKLIRYPQRYRTGSLGQTDFLQLVESAFQESIKLSYSSAFSSHTITRSDVQNKIQKIVNMDLLMLTNVLNKIWKNSLQNQ